MSTRGLIGFVVNGKLKATYNHSDSYPSYLGKEMLSFAEALQENDGEIYENVRSQAAALELIDESSKPTALQIAACGPYTNLDVSERSEQDWYCLFRNAQGNLTGYLDIGLMPDGNAFGEDSLMCEWGYLINLDTNMLEVYKGFQTTPPTRGYWTQGDLSTKCSPNEYYAINLLESWPLSALPPAGYMDALEQGE